MKKKLTKEENQIRLDKESARIRKRYWDNPEKHRQRGRDNYKKLKKNPKKYKAFLAKQRAQYKKTSKK